jgi:hypothetical protein
VRRTCHLQSGFGLQICQGALVGAPESEVFLIGRYYPIWPVPPESENPPPK